MTDIIPRDISSMADFATFLGALVDTVPVEEAFTISLHPSGKGYLVVGINEDFEFRLECTPYEQSLSGVRWVVSEYHEG